MATLPQEGRAKAPFLETLGPHRISVAVPIHDAYAVTSFGKEDEQVAAQRVVPEHVTNQGHEAVRALAYMDRLRRDEQAHARRQTQHARACARTSSRRDKPAELNDGGTRTISPEASTISNAVPSGSAADRGAGERTISS
jgi:hypothetical protein